MKTLFVLHDAPYPPRSGSPLRFWQHINIMAKFGEVHVFSVGYREPDASHPPILTSWTHVSAHEYPPARPSRIRRLRRLYRPRQFPFMNDAVTGAVNARLRAAIDAVQPDVVILSHWLHALPDALRDQPKLVVDAHNIESLLDADSPPGRHRLVQALANWHFRRRERAMFRRASAIWVTSEADARRLKRLDRKAPAPVVIPNAIDIGSYASVRDRSIARPPSFSGGEHVIGLVGLYAYQPNARAAGVLIDDIFPKVAASFDGRAHLLLVGKEPTPGMLAAAQRDPRIVVTGMVPDVRPYLALIDVLVVPLTEGGGTRVKILEAFAAGIAVVSTSKGAEGLDAVDGRDIFIAETPSGLAGAAIALLADPARRIAQALHARELLREKYSWDRLTSRVAHGLP